MPDYQQTDAPGTSWRRCNRVLIENPLNATPRVTLFEEDVAVVADKTIRSDCGTMSVQFDPTANVMLRDPQTGELTGGYLPQAEVYAILYSLYMQQAEQRDNPTTPSVFTPE